jgi:putative membrane protein
MPGPFLLAAAPHPLATVDAALNATATVLLVVGWLLIKGRRETAHKWVMLSAFAVSCIFLACYVKHHLEVGHVEFPGAGVARLVYLAILIPHIILAATVPVLAIITIYFGLRDRRAAHRRVARWTFPIWLYVSVTGVVIYWMLYHLYPGG